MADPITLSAHRPVPWLRVYLEETRLLLTRYWWFLAAFSLILMIWINYPLIVITRFNTANLTLVLDHANLWPIFLHPMDLFMLTTAAAWSLLIWSDRDPDQRSASWTMPVSRLTSHTARIVPGALLLLIIYLIGWYIGIIIVSTYVEVDGLVAGFLPPLSFVALGVSLLNVYLFSSLICLRFRQPYRWLLLYIPVFLLILFGLKLLLDMRAVNLLLSPLMPPHGLLGGLGIVLWDRMGDTVRPAVWVPFLWFGIISVSLYFTASRHQEV